MVHIKDQLNIFQLSMFNFERVPTCMYMYMIDLKSKFFHNEQSMDQSWNYLCTCGAAAFRNLQVYTQNTPWLPGLRLRPILVE